MSYESLIVRKHDIFKSTGIEGGDLAKYNLFPHQEALVRWSLRRGKSAIFADTGLGKSRMQLAWAAEVFNEIKKPILILAPLAVAAQTVKEGVEIGVSVKHCFDQSDVELGINITNYDRLHKFDPESFGAIVLDESSIIKHHDTKTLKTLLSCFGKTQFKLCATATPAPNDWTELGTHAEFLGVCTRTEMLSEYFCHDGAETQVWRLKGHARNVFWQWVSSWGALVRKPSDLGFDDAKYDLPPLNVHEHIVIAEHASNGMLFAMEALTLSERRDARRSTLTERVADCSAMVNSNDAPWVVWCELNYESEFLTKLINGAVEVRGSMDSDKKEKALEDFSSGKIRVIVTKPSIAGWGLNWQHCNSMAFVGVTDSFESYYQAIRRCWRFGQKMPVNVHLFVSKLEGAVAANLRRKEKDAMEMAVSLAKETSQSVKNEVIGSVRTFNNYQPSLKINVPSWLVSA